VKTSIIALAVLFAAPQAFAGWKTEFGAEDRVRAERKSDFDFNGALSDDGWLFFQRLRVNARATKGNYELFAEAMDLRVGSADLPKTAQEDDLDLHQAYLSAGNLFGAPLTLKAGRQELKYGKGRLVWAAVWANRINHFDAAVLKYKAGPLSADAFYGARVGWDEDGWNAPDRRDYLAGVYATWQKEKTGPLVDAYFLSNYSGASRSALSRHTAGLRAALELPGDVEFDAELPYQFGKSAGKSVYAYAFHLELARELDMKWSPRVAAAYNYASGDEDKNDSAVKTFVPLYQSTHDSYGLMDLFRWQNMEEAAFEVSLKPAEKLKVTAGTNFFWLADTKDYWYNSSGGKVRSGIPAAAGSYVGQEVSLAGKYDLGGGLSAEGAYARFYSGGYVDDTGSADDADWLYLQLCFKL